MSLTALYVDLADAVRDFVATTSSFRQPHSSRPEFERLAIAIAQIDAFPENDGEQLALVDG